MRCDAHACEASPCSAAFATQCNTLLCPAAGAVPVYAVTDSPLHHLPLLGCRYNPLLIAAVPDSTRQNCRFIPIRIVPLPCKSMPCCHGATRPTSTGAARFGIAVRANAVLNVACLPLRCGPIRCFVRPCWPCSPLHNQTRPSGAV